MQLIVALIKVHAQHIIVIQYQYARFSLLLGFIIFMLDFHFNCYWEYSFFLSMFFLPLQRWLQYKHCTYMYMYIHGLIAALYRYNTVYSGLFSRGVYFVNFEIAAIFGINFREINRKPHPRT